MRLGEWVRERFHKPSQSLKPIGEHRTVDFEKGVPIHVPSLEPVWYDLQSDGRRYVQLPDGQIIGASHGKPFFVYEDGSTETMETKVLR